MLIKLGLKYGDSDSLYLCDMIGHTIANTAIATSAELSRKYGSYPKFKHDAIIQSAFFTKNALGETKELVDKYGLHNSQLLTIAPTGTLSTMLQISGGIEPIFANSYERTTKTLHGHEQKYKVYTKIVKDYMDAHGLTDESQLPDYFVTSHEINYKNRIDMQSIWQTHIDASISSTVNVKNDFTVDEVESLYEYAWERGLKGITIYRDGCNREGILKTDASNKTDDNFKLNTIMPITRDQLGERLSGTTYVKRTACGKIYITINHDSDNNLVEVFVDNGKSGGCAANAEALGRYASLCLRSGISVDAVVDATKGVKCAACTKVKGSGRKVDGLSCSDVLARVIQSEYDSLKDKASNKCNYVVSKDKKPNSEQTTVSKCPECGNELIFDGGCRRCPECGWSKCD